MGQEPRRLLPPRRHVSPVPAGVPIVLDWASAGYATIRAFNAEGYSGSGDLNDDETVNDSCPSIRSTLATILDVFGDRNVDVLAHSMGGRLLYYVLAACPGYAQLWDHPSFFSDLILAAPDIGSGTFTRSASDVTKLSDSTTLYVSANDAALRFSQSLRGERPRAGQGGDNRVVVENVYTIDATTVEYSEESDALNHAYVFDVPQTRRDIS